MKKSSILLSIALFAGILPLTACDPAAVQYVSPMPNAAYVSPGATIILRFGPRLSKRKVANLKFEVNGSQSGDHPGQTILADDQKTVIFKPDKPFTAGEQVQVDVNSLQMDPMMAYNPVSYSFNVSIKQSS
jgi:hypothetical protein